MGNKSKYASFSGAQLHDTSGLESAAEPGNDGDAAWVQEYVSSPCCWELLEARPALPISSALDQYHHQKLRITR
jgi:hypothetical protein